MEQNLYDFSDRKFMTALHEPTHFYMAQVFNEKYPGTFKCVSIKNQNYTFYQYNSHVWMELDNTSVISNLISTELVSEYIELGIYLTKNINNSEEDNNGIISVINKIIYYLENSIFKQGMICEYANLIYDPNFINELNENTNLLCFNNAVLSFDDSTNVSK